MIGVGRILRTAPGWLAAATDRQIVALRPEAQRSPRARREPGPAHAPGHQSRRLRAGTGAGARPDRPADNLGRWVWKHELQSAVEDLVIGPQGFAAVTTTGGQLLIFDPAGAITIGFGFDATDPPLLIEAPRRLARWSRMAQPGTAVAMAARPWPCAARCSGTGRSPGRAGRSTASGGLALIAAADGRALLATDQAHFTARDRQAATPTTSSTSTVPASRFASHEKAFTLICSALDGRVLWRTVVDQAAGPVAAGTAGHRRDARQVTRLVQ